MIPSTSLISYVLYCFVLLFCAVNGAYFTFDCSLIPSVSVGPFLCLASGSVNCYKSGFFYPVGFDVGSLNFKINRI